MAKEAKAAIAADWSKVCLCRNSRGVCCTEGFGLLLPVRSSLIASDALPAGGTSSGALARCCSRNGILPDSRACMSIFTAAATCDPVAHCLQFMQRSTQSAGPLQVLLEASCSPISPSTAGISFRSTRPLLSNALTIYGQLGATVVVSWASKAHSWPLLMISAQPSFCGTAVSVLITQRIAASVIKFRTSPRSCIPTHCPDATTAAAENSNASTKQHSYVALD
mmetsp:Transcript_357/g.960  ORF Transcript_357/g.960 Transcript_357/m.960 type:complete len:223 (+) Transcript_357:964-1632(+)